VTWSAIAPDWHSAKRPRGFVATDPAAYPAGAWSRWDEVDRIARRMGIALDFVLTGGSPHWANGPGIPAEAADNPARAWFPSPREFGAFVTAVGRRYSGRFPDPADPTRMLPRIRFWSIWNEPNFGEDLGPQAIRGSTIFVAPRMYRNLLDSAWSALRASGHGHDTILIGELAARGLTGRPSRAHPGGLPGNFSQTKPLQFIRTLYCLDPHLHLLSGAAARSVGCPASRAGSRRFRAQNPALFAASGFADHPYPGNTPPTVEPSHDPNYATFPELPRLERQLDRIQRIYGSRTRFAIYNDEYGYITNPPHRGRYVSPTTAAYYLNWAEYLSWRSGRIASTMQYLLYDPPRTIFQPLGGFATGLLTNSGRVKPTYYAYRLPVYLPVTRIARRRAAVVWGCVRPAPFAQRDTGEQQFVQIQLRHGSSGAFRTVGTVGITDRRGYFLVRVRFPSSGTVRLSWTYPAGDPLLPTGTIHSRPVHVTLG
jgi:hypothetical protein